MAYSLQYRYLPNVVTPTSCYVEGYTHAAETADDDVVIPATTVGVNSLNLPVVGIDAEAFKDITTISSVTIGSNVTDIGEGAFQDCSLTSVIIPASVATVGDNAFLRCNSLTDIYYGGTIDQWVGISFAGANANPLRANAYLYINNTIANEIVIPNTVTNIGNYAFANYEEMISVTIGSGVTSIGTGAFYGCSGLTGVTIPNNVTSIGSVAFRNCSSLASVIIGDGVTSIGNGAFSGCNGLTSITIGNGVTTIGNSAFYGCSRLTSITIPDSVTHIGEITDIFTSTSGILAGCTRLTSITIPFIGETQKSISSGYRYPLGYLFAAASNEQHTGFDRVAQTITNYNGDDIRSSFYIPSSLRSVIITKGDILLGTFENCSMLTSITIGENVENVDTSEATFSGCSSLVNIYADANNLYYSDIDGVLFDANEETLVRYPTGRSSNSYVIPQGTVTIGSYAFSGTVIETITIPDSVTSIGYRAFDSCKALKNINLGEQSGLLTIGNYAFKGCGSILEFVIPDSVTRIGIEAFEGCAWLIKITVGSSVVDIYNEAFLNCRRLIEVYNKSALTITAGSDTNGYIAYYAKNVYTSAGGSNIVIDNAGYVLYEDGDDIILVGYLGEATQLSFPDNITEINANAFYGDTSITRVIIPENVTAIGEYAFYGCSALVDIEMLPPIPPVMADVNAFEDINENAEFYFLSSTIESYEAAENWLTYATKFIRDDLKVALVFNAKAARKYINNSLADIGSITILSTDWSNDEATKLIAGLGANDIITFYPASATDKANATAADIFVSANGSTVTFTATTTPIVSISFNYYITRGKAQ